MTPVGAAAALSLHCRAHPRRTAPPERAPMDDGEAPRLHAVLPPTVPPADQQFPERRGGRAHSLVLHAPDAGAVGGNTGLITAIVDLERQLEMQRTLTAVAAAGAGATGIAAALHTVTAMSVAIEDQFGHLLAWAGTDRPEPYPRRSRPRRDEATARAGPLRSGNRWVATAQRRNEVLGAIALVDPGRCADRHQLRALEHAAAVLTIELAHRRDLADAELRWRGDLVADLVTGFRIESAPPRAAALGHDLSGTHQVLVVRWSGVGAEEDGVRAVERAARLCGIDALVAPWSGAIVVVAARPASWERQHRWSQMLGALTKVVPGTTGCIGVGTACATPADLIRSYTEALHALAVRASSDSSGLTCFEDLGVLQLLFPSADHGAVEQFVRDWLGTLIDYDRSKGTDLVATLSHYFDSGGNYDQTAAALHIHRSTLRYRIKRIRELTGHELGAVDCRLNLQVATRAWQVLQGSC
jgi:sugar diacid utilization regulator